MVIGGLVNSPIGNKTISITNFNFTNGSLADNKAVISTNGIELDGEIDIIFTNLIFSNITFSSRGTLIECKQQLNSYLVISNSEFSDLNAAVITIQSSNTQNSNLSTLVRINDTMFNNINDGFNSFINVNEGGQLEINN